MASVNKFIGIGNLGRDPETRYAADGGAVTNFSIACTESWKDKSSGEKKEKTEWVRIATFGKLAEIAGEYLKKGSQVYVEGRLQTREWEKDGVKRYTTEIIADRMQMLGGKAPEGNAAAPAKKPEPTDAELDAARGRAMAKAGGKFDDFEDDIPF